MTVEKLNTWDALNGRKNDCDDYTELPKKIADTFPLGEAQAYIKK